MTDHHDAPRHDDADEAEGLALYARLREEARAQIFASAAALMALPGDLPRRALTALGALLLVGVRDVVAVNTGAETTGQMAVQAVAACVEAVCQMASDAAA